MQLKMRLFHVFFNGRPLNLNLKIYKKIRTVFSMFETPIQVSFSKFENLSEMKHPTVDFLNVVLLLPSTVSLWWAKRELKGRANAVVDSGCANTKAPH